RQSFPALIILSMSRGDIEPRLGFDEQDPTLVKVYEPYVALTQTRGWVPMKHWQFLRSDWYDPATWFSHPFTETKRITAADELESVRSLFASLNSKAKFVFDRYLTNALIDRLVYYENQLIGATHDVELPYDHLVPETPSEN